MLIAKTAVKQFVQPPTIEGADAAEQNRIELCASLLAPQSSISPKYFYNALGSKLFETICELPEYYPTRTEAAIFSAYLSDMAAAIGPGTTLIDLGAGNCAKAARLFPFLHPAQYVPVDISADHLHDSVAQLRQRFPFVDMVPLGMDFSSAFVLPENVRQDQRLFFYPGSSIGNFSPLEASAFLRRLRHASRKDGGLLIGVDLIKDKAILDAAYDDVLGVTAAFNVNTLNHVNQLLDADFDLRNWRHLAGFNEEKGRVEMHLESKVDQLVKWSGGQRRYTQGERIHTENSYKYTVDAFVELLEQAGFTSANIWMDENKWFAVIHAHALV